MPHADADTILAILLAEDLRTCSTIPAPPEDGGECEDDQSPTRRAPCLVLVRNVGSFEGGVRSGSGRDSGEGGVAVERDLREHGEGGRGPVRAGLRDSSPVRSSVGAIPCAVTGCPWYAAATDVETLADYCPAHLDEWLAAEGDS